MAEVDPLKVELAKRCATLFIKQMAGVPADVQLMGIELLAKTIFSSDVQESKRLELFDRWAKSIREEVLKGVRTNGKKTRNR